MRIRVLLLAATVLFACGLSFRAGQYTGIPAAYRMHRIHNREVAKIVLAKAGCSPDVIAEVDKRPGTERISAWEFKCR